jgi:asparagine synthase (glutamine-hydrolysing)
MFPMLRAPIAELYQQTQTGAEPASLIGRAFKAAVHRGRDFPPPRVIGTAAPARVPWTQGLNPAIAVALSDMRAHRYLEVAHAESRVAFHAPFLDPEMVDVALTVPERLKIDLRTQKIVLRRAVEGLLPPQFARRPKAIQRIRPDTALGDILDGMANELLTPDAVRRRGFVAPDYVARVRRRRGDAAYATDRLYRLWTLVSLELWARQFVDARGAFVGLQSPRGL